MILTWNINDECFFKLLTAIGLGRLTLQVMAGNTEDNIRQQQDIQQRQREEQLRQTMQPETDVRLLCVYKVNVLMKRLISLWAMTISNRVLPLTKWF